jgi:hypothetical protein
MFNFIEIKEQIIEKMFYELLPLEEFFSLSTIHIDKNILFLYFRLFFEKGFGYVVQFGFEHSVLLP